MFGGEVTFLGLFCFLLEEQKCFLLLFLTMISPLQIAHLKNSLNFFLHPTFAVLRSLSKMGCNFPSSSKVPLSKWRIWAVWATFCKFARLCPTSSKLSLEGKEEVFWLEANSIKRSSKNTTPFTTNISIDINESTKVVITSNNFSHLPAKISRWRLQSLDV